MGVLDFPLCLCFCTPAYFDRPLTQSQAPNMFIHLHDCRLNLDCCRGSAIRQLVQSNKLNTHQGFPSLHELLQRFDNLSPARPLPDLVSGGIPWYPTWSEDLLISHEHHQRLQSCQRLEPGGEMVVVRRYLQSFNHAAVSAPQCPRKFGKIAHSFTMEGPGVQHGTRLRVDLSTRGHES